MQRSAWAALLAIAFGLAPAVAAQEFALDVRRLALSEAAEVTNIALDRAPGMLQYRSVVLPLGLVDLLRERRTLNPSSPAFNAFLVLQALESPIHATIRRYPAPDAEAAFGAEGGRADGLFAPNWGARRPLGRTGRVAHAAWLGAGPYVAGTVAHDVTPGDGLFAAAQSVVLQSAVAISGGYHAHVALGAGVYGESPRNGLYLAARYHHLEGVRLDTASSEFLVPFDPAGRPIPAASLTGSVTHEASWFGRGRSVESGAVIVLDDWEVGGTLRGAGNFVDWGQGRRLRLPREHAVHVAFHSGRWSARGAYARGFQRTSTTAGVEFRSGGVALRTGVRHTLGRVHPSGGIGIGFAGDKGIDLALFTSTLPVTGDRLLSAAVSFRLGLALPPSPDRER